eukprot:gene5213-3723_t
MAGTKEKYIISKMSTVLIINFDGKDLKSEEDKINKKVERKVKEIIDKLKTTHSKFEDPDFGPTADDEYGAVSLYGGKVFCENGRLFIDGSSSGDVIQGQLGDCWFLSALAVLGADDNLLENCFWRREEFREYGLYVLRFFKDCSLFFVLIDDRLPVKDKDGRLIFAGGKDPDELWVPLIEKAYAKLHGCYKALIGGYTHYGLADMTGFSPRLVVMREGYLGFSQRYEPDDLWALMSRYSAWKSMMGCSIQPAPNDKRKVEAEAGQGLHMGHAYSLLALGEVTLNAKTGEKVRLMKLRNPWGRGEWEGRFSDNSPERATYAEAIAQVFDAKVKKVERAQIDHADGTFFMPFDDWLKHYTSLFVAVNFPATWIGRRVGGSWSGEQGGNRDMGTWITNPKFKLRLETNPAGSGVGKGAAAAATSGGQEYRAVFVGLYIKDSRLTMGFDYYKDPLYATPLTFDIVSAAELTGSNATQKNIPKAVRYYPFRGGQGPEACAQPPYNFGATQVEVYLQPNEDYYIIPSLYKRNQPGDFFLTVYADCDKLQLDGSAVVSETHRPMQVAEGKVTLKMSVAQFNEKKESLRDRIVSEAKRMNISFVQIRNLLLNNNQESLSRAVFKRRMMDAGFMLTDFPDDDFVVLDGDTGQIKINEFLDFIAKGMSFEEGVTHLGPPPAKPVDDLLFKAIDLSGELRVHINSARGLRDASAWFKNIQAVHQALGNAAAASAATTSTVAAVPPIRPRTLIVYDPAKAQAARQRAIKERSVPPQPRFAHEATSSSAAAAAAAAAASSSTAAGAPSGPATGGAGGGGGKHPLSLSLDTDFDGLRAGAGSPLRTLTLHSAGPATANAKAGGGGGGKAMTVVSQMSMTQKDLVSRAGAGAAVKLHSDALLQRAEVKRTQHLSMLRNNRASSASGAGALVSASFDATGKATGAAGTGAGGRRDDEITIMRASTKASSGKKARRDIRKHVEVMQWLGIALDEATGGGPTKNIGSATAPSVASTLPLRAALQPTATAATKKGQALDAISSTTTALATVQGATASMTATVATPPTATATATVTAAPAAASVASGRSRPYDLWDLLIDNVYTICASRPLHNAKTQRHRLFLEMKRKPLHSEQLQLLDGHTPSPLPTPTKISGTSRTPATAAAAQKNLRAANGPTQPLLALGTPRGKLISRGVASVKGAHVSKTQTKQTIVEARDKLLALQQAQGKTYVEIYRRLLSIATTSYEEMSGERASKATVSLTADSTAYLRKLFEKFDTNGNGLISKDEFRLAMQDLNIELSREDCDIFFNRFTGAVPGNINWKEFVEFFQHEIAGATVKSITGQAATSSGGGGGGAATAAAMNGGGSGKVGMDLNLVNTLMELRRLVRDAVARMQQQRVTSIDAYLEANRMQSTGGGGLGTNAAITARRHSRAAVSAAPAAGAVAEPKTPSSLRPKKVFVDDKTVNGGAPSATANAAAAGASSSSSAAASFKVPPNAIFQTLTLSQVKSNTANMQALGLLHLTEVMMARISRIFDFSVTNLMDFVLSDPSAATAAAGVTTAAATAAAAAAVAAAAEGKATGPVPTVDEPTAAAAAVVVSGDLTVVLNDANVRGAAGVASLTPAKPAAAAAVGGLTRAASQSTVPPLPLAATAATATPTATPTLVAVAAPLDVFDPPHSTTAKIWSSFAPTLDALSPFDTIVRYLFSLLQECHQLEEKEVPLVSPRAVKDPMVRGIERKSSMGAAPLSAAQAASSASSSAAAAAVDGATTVVTGKKLFFRGMDVSVLVRVVVDAMIYSSWNRLPATRKLQYLIHLEHDRTKSATFFLVHVYVSSDGEELVVLADDPLSGDVHKLHLFENVKQLPHGEALRALFLQNKALAHALQHAHVLLPPGRTAAGATAVDTDALYLYNPVDTPQEDAAVSAMLARLKLVRSHATNSAQLVLAEDPLLVQQIKTLMDASAKALPFFYVLNDLYVSFEVDEMAINRLGDDDADDDGRGRGRGAVASSNGRGRGATGAASAAAATAAAAAAASTSLVANSRSANAAANSASRRAPSVRSVVFGSIRSQKALCTFLTQVQSSLKVVLTTYNSTLRETFDWDEMLAHLSNQRNPFVTAQLLPKYIAPERYLYEPQEKFAFNFHAPKMTSCEVHAREVVKLKLDSVTKYVMVLIREGQRRARDPPPGNSNSNSNSSSSGQSDKETFLFLTLYDPRSATEYQVGVKPQCPLFQHLYYHRLPGGSGGSGGGGQRPADYFNIDLLRERVNQAAEKEDLFVGPAITPRIQINVYNHKDEKLKELIGTSQVSVSAVLSGSGVSDRVWVKLVNMVEKPAAAASSSASSSAVSAASAEAKMGEMKLVEEPAGEIEVELRFRRSIEMLGEMKAKANAKALKRQASSLKQPAGDEGASDGGPSGSGGGGGGGGATRSMATAAASQGKAKELAQQLAATQEKLQRAESEYAKLFQASNSGGGKAPAAAAAAATAAAGGAAAGSPSADATIAQLETDKQQLQAETQRLQTEREKWQREHAAVLSELHRLEEQVATASQSKDSGSGSGSGGVTTTPRGKLAEAKAQAEVQELKATNQQLQEQERAAKKAAEDLKQQLQRMKEEHAKTVEEMYRLQETAATSAATPAAATSSAAAGAASTTTLGDVAALPAMDLQHVLQILTTRYERKIKLTGATNAPVTAAPILDTLQRLLHSFATPEGMITQRELLVAFSELMIDVNTEFAVKVVQDVGPDARKMVQVHAVMDHFKRELTQLLKVQQRKLRGSEASLRMSQEGPVLGTKAAAAAAAVGSGTTAPTEAKARPASAVVQGSGKAAVAAMKQQGGAEDATAGPAKKVVLRSQSAKVEAAPPASTTAVETPATNDADYWHTQPLPPKWERKFHPPANRFVYIDHERHKTQWHHPLDPSGGKSAGVSAGAGAAPARPSGQKPAATIGAERLARTVEIPRAAAGPTTGSKATGGNGSAKEKLNQTYSGPARVTAAVDDSHLDDGGEDIDVPIDEDDDLM